MNPTLSPKIRKATVTDATRLATFGARLFKETFGKFNTPEDMEDYLSSNFSFEKQKTEISDSDILTLIAESDDQLIGYSQIHRMDAPGFELGEHPLELKRFYVDQPWQGTGFAQKLMEATMVLAKDFGGSAIWLSVWEENQRAIAFYKKSGFLDIGTKDFWLGKDRQTDRVMMAAIET
jgi:ribosomal protein S18 acetylase RimI-like enzyme